MHSFPDRHPRSEFRHRVLAVCGALAVCASCTAPRRAPLCDADVAAGVQRRGTSVEEMETALALANLGSLEVPRPATANLDPAMPEFWDACAYLYEPGVRKARRTLQAKRALARGAGAVPALDLSADRVGAGEDRETEAMATFDLLALFGAGPAAAAKELARSEVCKAFADLETAVWSARFRVWRIVLRVGAALERERVATVIAREAAEDEQRIAILEQAGRGSPAEIAWARSSLARIAEAAARARIDVAQAREELSVATGLPPTHPALQSRMKDWRLTQVSPDVMSSWLPEAETRPGFLLARVPSLRALKLEYAVAEARVRSAAAATWPGIAIGPKLKIIPDAVLGGGIVDLSIPLPGATCPAIRAAVIERTAAREALEDELVRVLARNHSLNERRVEIAIHVVPRAETRRNAAREMWRASRARFRSDESAVGAWALALDMRLDAELDLVTLGEMEDQILQEQEEASGPIADDIVDLRSWYVPHFLTETRPQ